MLLMRLSFNGITSTFIRSEWPSVDIPLDNEVFVKPKGYNAPEQVHITQGDYDGKAMIIIWVTPDEPGSNQVKYGTSEKKYDFTAKGETVKNYTFYNYTSGYIHQYHLENLEYDTKYYYEIGEGDSARSFWFQTPPKIDPNASYKFGSIGDLGQTYNSLSTLEHYVESGAQTVLHVGDISYADRYKYHDMVKYTPQWEWLQDEFKKVDRKQTPWLINKVDVVFAGHVHAYERSYRISNIHYNITSGVHKDHKNPFLMSGCKVVDGYGTMLATSVGIHTEWGLIMASISEDNGEETSLQVRLNGVATFIGIVGLVVAVSVLVILLVRFFTGHTEDDEGRIEFIAGKTSVGDAVDGAIKIFTVAVPDNLSMVPNNSPLRNRRSSSENHHNNGTSS
ncbi:hypothetical protein LXL04_021248 [Taraxacum kok-saghyz]